MSIVTEAIFWARGLVLFCVLLLPWEASAALQIALRRPAASWQHRYQTLLEQGPAGADVANISGAKPHLLRVDQRRRVVLVEQGPRGCWSTSRRPLWLPKERRLCRPLPASARLQVRWFWAAPRALDYDNVRACGLRLLQRRSCVQTLLYRRRELRKLRGARGFWTTAVRRFVAGGTFRISARLWYRGRWSSTRGGRRVVLQAAHVAQMTTLVFRRDDSYVGYLTELLGVPFVYYPGWWRGKHQTDQRLGADCVASLIYGRRRMGKYIPYVAPPALKQYTRRLGAVAAGARHTPRRVLSGAAIRRGDILHFGFQTAVISRDTPPIGRLNPTDVIFHTYHKRAMEQPLSALPYGRLPFVLLRWR